MVIYMASGTDKKEKRREQILNAPILPLLIKTALPTIVGMLVTMIYNLTDTFMIGLLDNKSMTAAIGVVFSFASVIQAIGFWFGYGSGNTMSRCLGAGQEEEAAVISSTGIVLASMTGIIMMIPALYFVKPLAGLLGGNASETLLMYTTDYLRIVIYSIPFSLFSVTLYNQLRLCGNVKDGMIGLLAGMLTNMILDPVLIFGLKTGFLGAGWATLAGQITGCVVLTVLAGRNGNIPVRFNRVKFSGKRLYHILAGGAPNFARQSITSVAAVLLNMVAAEYGDTMIAALTVSTKIIALFQMVMIGWGQGFQPICAMNYGAGKYTRVKQALEKTIVIGTVFLFFSTIIIAIFATPLTGMLTRDKDVINLGTHILCIQCVTLPLMGIYTVSSMFMQNIGHYFESFWISVARQGVFFIPSLFILEKFWGQNGLFLAQPAADALAFVFSVIVLLRWIMTHRHISWH